EAAKYFRLSADDNDEDGQFFLGWMYEKGRGVTKNKTEAIYWYQKASDQGEERARERLAKLLNG
ncbi:MAG: sel1 repeat family protein, partial [Gammaproteobacteria bacterium]|nr:sel1 repeat family protein [Gammaproteobacteria bacterium]